MLVTPLLSLAFLSSALMTSCAVKQSQESVGQYVDGSVMTTTIKSKILADKKLRNTTITVKTYQDTVQLSGFVNNQFQKNYATDLTLTVDGVRNVDNSLIIKKHR